jgi:hypothetical protein
MLMSFNVRDFAWSDPDPPRTISHYHGWSDTPDKLNFEAMGEVTRSILLFLAALRGSPQLQFAAG